MITPRGPFCVSGDRGAQGSEGGKGGMDGMGGQGEEKHVEYDIYGF